MDLRMTGFKVHENEYPHFVTMTIAEWLPIFLSQPYLDVVVKSLRFCQEQKSLRLHAYVIMPDHLHLVASGTKDLARTIGQFKSFTSHQIVGLLETDRKRLYLWVVTDAARKQGEGEHKVWQDGYHPEQIYSQKFLEQKARYIHENPVRKGLVAEPADWLHSSAEYYEGRGEGVLKVEPVMWYNGRQRGQRPGMAVKPGGQSPPGIRSC